MIDDELFKDTKHVRVETPYSKLRKMHNLTQDEAAEKLCIQRRALIDIERGARDPTKQTVRLMESLYECGGKLREYWWNKFSVDLGILSWWEKAIEALKRKWGA